MALVLSDPVRNPISPPLKWAGGKRWLVPHLFPFWRRHMNVRLVEPFVGGLAVTLGLAPKQALLNDLNPHLVSFYRWLQRGLDLRPFKSKFANNQTAYLRNRRRFNELVAENKYTESEAAALFYYLNRTGYNGLCRFNTRGFFNVPFGRYKNLTYRDDFFEYKDALKGFGITASDFESLRVRRNDLIYADPPYDVEFTAYSAGGFSWEDQTRLAKWLAGHSGPVIASNQATRRVLKLYRSLGFQVQILSAPRRISCDGNRDDAREMLAVRNVA
jgi:DNA adenine methylase